MALFLLLLSQSGKNMSVLGFSRPGFIAGKPMHLVAVTASQKLTNILLRSLGRRNLRLLPCNQRIQAFYTSSVVLLLLGHLPKQHTVPALKPPRQLQIGIGIS